MIIDMHCHVWPDHIAPAVLATRPAGLDGLYDGTVSGLLRSMDAADVDRAVCLGIAHQARTVERTNEFIGALDRTRLVPFGTIHPSLTDEQNLRSLRDNGIHGVKLHPLFQGYSLGDPRTIDLLRALAANGIVVITHVGGGGDQAANERGNPTFIPQLAEAVPGLILIACHFGGYHDLDGAEAEVVQSRVIIETSWPPSLAKLPGNRIRSIIARHGADRVVFGSDWPMANPAAEVDAIRALNLPADDEAKVLGGNCAGLLGLQA